MSAAPDGPDGGQPARRPRAGAFAALLALAGLAVHCAIAAQRDELASTALAIVVGLAAGYLVGGRLAGAVVRARSPVERLNDTLFGVLALALWVVATLALGPAGGVVTGLLAGLLLVASGRVPGRPGRGG